MQLNIKTGLIFGIIGILVMLACYWIYQQKTEFIEHSVKIAGRVVKTQTSGTGDSKNYSIIVSFKNQNGEDQTTQIYGSSNLKNYSKDDTVDLRYAKDSPEILIIDDFWELWSTPLMVGLIGMIFTIAGLGILIKGSGSQYCKR